MNENTIINEGMNPAVEEVIENATREVKVGGFAAGTILCFAVVGVAATAKLMIKAGKKAYNKASEKGIFKKLKKDKPVEAKCEEVDE